MSKTIPKRIWIQIYKTYIIGNKKITGIQKAQIDYIGLYEL